MMDPPEQRWFHHLIISACGVMLHHSVVATSGERQKRQLGAAAVVSPFLVNIFVENATKIHTTTRDNQTMGEMIFSTLLNQQWNTLFADKPTWWFLTSLLVIPAYQKVQKPTLIDLIAKIWDVMHVLRCNVRPNYLT